MTSTLIEGECGSYAELIEVIDMDMVILHTIYVPFSARGQGLGNKLLQASIEWATSREKLLLLAPVPDTNVTFDVRAWYVRHGFVSTPSGMMMEYVSNDRDPQPKPGVSA